MAEQSGSMSDILDVVLPAFAFLASASSRYGAAGVQGMLATMGMRERSKYRKDERQRLQDAMSAREQEAALALPGKQLAAAQSGFQLGNLRDVSQQLQAPTASPDAVQALGEPTAMRLQSALQAGEQVPLPQEAPSQAIQTQRLGQMATTPEGAARLQAAGLGDIASAAMNVQGERRQQQQFERTGQEKDAEAAQKIGAAKLAILEDLRGYPADSMPEDIRQRITLGVKGAQDINGILDAVKDMPPGSLKPKSARIEEYQFYADQAKQAGQTPLNFQEFQLQQRRASSTRITTNVGQKDPYYGEAPKDMVWARDADGKIKLDQDPATGAYAPVAVPIKGGTVDQEIKGAMKKGALGQEQAKQAGDIVTDDINRALGLIGSSPTPIAGFLGSKLSKIAGTSAFQLSTYLDTIGSAIAKENLSRMRASSPTGGALGQVSDADVALLKTSFGSLSQGQSDEDLTYNLKRIYNLYQDIVHDRGKGPTRFDLSQGPRPPQQGVVSIGPITPTAPGGQAVPALPGVPDISQMTPADLQKLSPEQLDALEQQLRGK